VDFETTLRRLADRCLIFLTLLLRFLETFLDFLRLVDLRFLETFLREEFRRIRNFRLIRRLFFLRYLRFLIIGIFIREG
jgi:hypothetical protein